VIGSGVTNSPGATDGVDGRASPLTDRSDRSQWQM
jgi:hypothetical protein